MAILQVVPSILQLLKCRNFHLVPQCVGGTLCPLLPQMLHPACVVVRSHAPCMHLSVLNRSFRVEFVLFMGHLLGHLLLQLGLILQSLITSISLFQVFFLVLVSQPNLELAHEFVFLSSIHV